MLQPCAPTLLVAAAIATLAGCAMPPMPARDFSAINRPAEVRCARLQDNRGGGSRPGLTRAEVQAEARAAASRGELDRDCDQL